MILKMITINEPFQNKYWQDVLYTGSAATCNFMLFCVETTSPHHVFFCCYFDPEMYIIQ